MNLLVCSTEVVKVRDHSVPDQRHGALKADAVVLSWDAGEEELPIDLEELGPEKGFDDMAGVVVWTWMFFGGKASPPSSE